MRVAFVYPNPRSELARSVAAGLVPDTALLGQNHLRAFGIDAFVHDSRVRRRTPRSALVHRVTWHLRELVVPLELRDADVVVSPLANLLPLAARVPGSPRVLILSYHLVAAWSRAGPMRRRLLRASLRSADGILVSSTAARDHLVSQIGLPPEHVRVALLGVDGEWWRSTPAPRDGHVLTVGRDLARDYGTFGEAMAGLDRRGIVVAKEENLRGVSLPANVEVRLNVEPAEVRELYAGASCVVIPVRPAEDPRGTENSGTIALLEAMACRRPVVVSERAYLRDYVAPGTARVVPPADPVALRDAISAVLDDHGAAAAMAAAGRRAVEEHHSTRRLAERLSGAVEDLPWH